MINDALQRTSSVAKWFRCGGRLTVILLQIYWKGTLNSN